jgi:hypothetical protein
MDKRLRRRFEAMPLGGLHRLIDDLQELLVELENHPPREVDIAADHRDPKLIAKVLRVEGDPHTSNWYQIERIYCSSQRCARCPHGDFRFRYQRNKQRGTITKKLSGTMAFSHETREQLNAGVREPVYVFEFDKDVSTISYPGRD